MSCMEHECPECGKVLMNNIPWALKCSDCGAIMRRWCDEDRDESPWDGNDPRNEPDEEEE